ncbi:MAG TPA: dihydropteroate synthase [Aeromicrobium sp.]|nr:dihydropteroate synthase [Aeromicrobium sp.]
MLANLPHDRCLVMGVVNVTPDSFSDGGKWFDPETAIAHGLDLLDSGADIIDVGGESTRPGANRVDCAEELRRVIPVVEGLAVVGATVSVDTMRSEVAAQSLAAGAHIINDVSGGRSDPDVLRVAATSGVPFVLMHWRAHSYAMQNSTDYVDVVADIVRELTDQIEVAKAAGITDGQLIIDPGLGFSKTGDQNWTVLANLDALTALGYPVLVAASRKRFLGELLSGGGGLRPVDEREAATAAISTLAAAHGAWCVRVHDVLGSADAIRTVARWNRG